MKYFKYIFSIAITAVVFSFIVINQVHGLSIFQYFQGGTGTTTAPVSQLIYGGYNAYQSVATTSVNCTGSTSCLPFTAIGGSAITITSSGTSFSGSPNSVVATDGTGALIATSSQLTTGSLLSTTTAISTFMGPVSIRGVGTSTIANLGGTYYVPPDYATNGCAGDVSKTDFGSCVNALYALGANKGNYAVTIKVPNIYVPSANWTTGINFGTNGLAGSLQCERGATLIWGGVGTSTVFNMGNPTGHTVSDNYGCSYQGNTTLIAAAQNNTKMTGGIFFGGNQGGVGINFHDNNVNGFGVNLGIGANAYMLNINHNSISGGNGTTTAWGSLLQIAPASNSGERNIFSDNSFTDPGNSVEDNCIYIASGATASNFFTHNSIDDCQMRIGASNGITDISGNQFENAAYATYGAYIPILGVSSDESTMITFNSNVIANDTSGANSFVTIIEHGGQLYASGNSIQNYGGGTITNFVLHDLDNGKATDYVCQTQVQGGALTNVIGGSGGVAYSRATGATCVHNTDNSYSIGMRANSNNVNDFFSGSVTAGTYDHSGNWFFLGNVNMTDGKQYQYGGTKIAMGQPTQQNWYLGNSGNLTGSGTYNTALGDITMQSLSNGSQNTGVGGAAFEYLSSGSSNVGIGFNAQDLITSGSQNVGIGVKSLLTNDSGIGNIGIGFQAGYSLTGGGNIIIGQNVEAPVAGNNAQLNIGNLIYGTGLYNNAVTKSSVPSGGKVGIGSTTPGTLFSIGGNLTGINFTDNGTTTSNAKGFDLRGGGCFAINGVCISGSGGGSGTVTSVLAGAGFQNQGLNITSSGTLVGALATSATPSLGGLAFWSGLGSITNPATLGTVATTTLSGGGPITVSNSPVVLGASGAVLGCATCNTSNASVSSVGLSLPSFFTITNSPVTTTGTLTGTISFPANSIITADSAGTNLIGTSSQLTVGSILATSTLGSATSTFPHAIRTGLVATARDNLNQIDCSSRVWPASISTGGCVNISNGAVNTGPALVIQCDTAGQTTGRCLVLTDSSSSSTQDPLVASSTANVSFDFRGAPTSKGVIKCEHIGAGITGFSNASCVSIDTSVDDAQGFFIKTGTGIPFQIQNSASNVTQTMIGSGFFGIGTTTPGTIFAIGSSTTNFINLDINATSTFGKFGVNIKNGCYAIAGTCIGGGSGSGSVTSVDMTVPTGFSVSGNPVTTSGTLALALNQPARALLGTDSLGTSMVATGTGNAGLTVSYITATGTSATQATSTFATDVVINRYLRVGPATLYPNDSRYPADFVGSNNGFLATNIQNTNSGTCATADLTTANNTSTDVFGGYTDLSISSGNYNGTGCSATDIPMTGVKYNSTSLFNPNGPQLNFMLGTTSLVNSAMNWGIGGYTASNFKMTLLGNGNLGIGTTTPSYLLTLASTTSSQLSLSAGAGLAQWAFRNAGGNLYFSTTTVVGTATSSLPALSILGAGKPSLAISSTSPNATLTVETRAGDFNNSFFVGSSTEYFRITNGGAVFAPNTSSSGSSQTGYWCYDTNGQFIRDTAVCLVSALKFKKDVKNLDVGLSDLLSLRPVSYFYKDPSFGDKRQMGFIADEVASSSSKLNEMLVTYDSQGAVHGFNYLNFTSLITKSIQDFYGQFQKLVRRVSGLDKKVNDLQKEVDSLNLRLSKLENK